MQLLSSGQSGLLSDRPEMVLTYTLSTAWPRCDGITQLTAESWGFWCYIEGEKIGLYNGIDLKSTRCMDTEVCCKVKCFTQILNIKLRVWPFSGRFELAMSYDSVSMAFRDNQRNERIEDDSVKIRWQGVCRRQRGLHARWEGWDRKSLAICIWERHALQ